MGKYIVLFLILIGLEAKAAEYGYYGVTENPQLWRERCASLAASTLSKKFQEQVLPNVGIREALYERLPDGLQDRLVRALRSCASLKGVTGLPMPSEKLDSYALLCFIREEASPDQLAAIRKWGWDVIIGIREIIEQRAAPRNFMNTELVRAFINREIFFNTERSDDAHTLWNELVDSGLITNARRDCWESTYNPMINVRGYHEAHGCSRVLVLGCGKSVIADHASAYDVAGILSLRLPGDELGKRIPHSCQHCYDAHSGELTVALYEGENSLDNHADISCDAITLFTQMNAERMQWRVIKDHSRGILVSSEGETPLPNIDRITQVVALLEVGGTLEILQYQYRPFELDEGTLKTLHLEKMDESQEYQRFVKRS